MKGRPATMTLSLLLIRSAAEAPVVAQAPAPTPAPPLVSPEVHTDRRVTFRLRAPSAKEIVVERQGVKLPMQKDEQGLWTVTTEPLEPDIYGYSFVVDGVTHFDPSNPATVPNYLYTASSLHVPGPPSLPWEVGPAPRGAVHHHFHHSAVVGDDRDFYVYTPPGYDPKDKKPYPVLYLLHGFSDDARAWTDVGRAHVILDNLIASGRARPMLVVMPFGYGAPEILSRTGPQFRDVALRKRNQQKFRETLLQDVIPMVEKLYRVPADRESRAVAGLSMGGGEALDVGPHARDHFAWGGAFRSGGSPHPPPGFPRPPRHPQTPPAPPWVARRAPGLPA